MGPTWARLGLDPSTSLRAGSRGRPSPHELRWGEYDNLLGHAEKTLPPSLPLRRSRPGMHGGRVVQGANGARSGGERVRTNDAGGAAGAAEKSQGRPARGGADGGNHGGEADRGVDSDVPSGSAVAHCCDPTRVREWRFYCHQGKDYRGDGRGDGSAGRGQCGGIDRVRHVQGARQGHRNPGSGAGAEVGRQERRLPEKREAEIVFDYLSLSLNLWRATSKSCWWTTTRWCWGCCSRRSRRWERLRSRPMRPMRC